MALLVENGEQTFFDINGDPLSGGKVYFYVANTGTPANTWQDAGLTTLNTNPVILDQAGRAVIWGNQQYRQIVQDQFGNTQWDRTAGFDPSSVNGNLHITNNLQVDGSGTVTGNFSVGQHLTVGNGADITGNINTNSIGVTGAVNAGSMSATTGNFTTLTAGTISASGDVNVNGNLGVAAGKALFVDTIDSQTSGAYTHFNNGIIVEAGISAGIAVSAHGRLQVTGDLIEIVNSSTPRLWLSDTASPGNYGIYAGTGSLILGKFDGGGAPSVNYMLMNDSDGVVIYKNVYVDGTVTSHNFITATTDVDSPALEFDCLPYVLSVPVKTEPNIGLAPGDLYLAQPVAQMIKKEAGAGVPYNAVAGVLWKAMQELNAATMGRQQAAAMATTPDPPDTNSTAFVMAGMNATLTPTGSTRAIITVGGMIGNLINNVSAEVQIMMGTGTPPTSGDSLTGTKIGNGASMLASRAADFTPFSLTALVTGLVVGTQYWIGAAYRTGAGGTATLTALSVTVFELLDPQV